MAAGPSLTLATLGVALTSLVLGFLIHLILKFDLVYSLLISSIISSTDAAGVFMITKANPIKSKLAVTLNVESAANDPMAILLTVTFVQIATKAFNSPLFAVTSLIWQFAGGIIIGFVSYKISLFVFNRLRSDNHGNYNVLILGCILFAYGVSDLLKVNGIIAVFFMGYWLGNSAFPAKRSVSSFLESVSTIFNITLFIVSAPICAYLERGFNNRCRDDVRCAPSGGTPFSYTVQVFAQRKGFFDVGRYQRRGSDCS